MSDKKPELKNLEDKSKKYGDIAVFADSVGGKQLADTVKIDIVNTISAIMQSYKTLSHPELIAICADLKANVNMLRVLKNAKKNKEEVDLMLEELTSSL